MRRSLPNVSSTLPCLTVRAMLTDAPADAEAIWQKQEDAHAYDLLPQKEKVFVTCFSDLFRTTKLGGGRLEC